MGVQQFISPFNFEGYLGCLQLRALTNKAAKDIHVLILV